MQLPLKTYLKRLTNLSSRNRSLVLTSLPSEQFIDLHDLDFLDNSPSFSIIEQLIARKKTIRLCAIADPRFERTNDLSKKLRRLARTEKFIADERGSQDLYVGWPFVRGKFMDGTVVHGPLAFFFVTLEQTEKHWQLNSRAEAIALNRSFLLAYSHFNQVNVSDDLLETNLNDLDTDPLSFRTQLYELLKNSTISLNFNQDLFQDKLAWFDVQKVADLDLLEKNGELKLYPEAVLGVFPQSGSYLAPDYEKLLEDNGQWIMHNRQQPNGVTNTNDLRLATGDLKSIKEAETFTAFPQDASQELALKRIKQGESLVVQGPPGSGKSQLIANLVADFTARGKRVLVVCQKRVALDVVYERIKQVGATPFVALIHDFKNDRAELYRQISTQIDNVEDLKKQNYTLDAVLLERQFLQVSRAIDQIVAELDDFKRALFDENICGLSAKELYLMSEISDPQVDLSDIFRNFKFNEIQNFEQKLKQYFQYANLFLSTHFWYERVNFAEFNFLDLQQIKKILIEIPDWVNEKTTKHWSLQRLLYLQNEKPLFSTIQNLNESTFNITKQLLDDRYLEEYWNTLVQQLTHFQKNGLLGNECTSSELSLFVQRLDKIIETRQSILKWPFYGDKTYFKNLTTQYGLGLDLYDLLKLKEKFNSRKKWELGIGELANKLKINLLDDVFSKTMSNFELLKTDFNAAQHFVEEYRRAAISCGFESNVEGRLQIGDSTRPDYKSGRTLPDFQNEMKALIELSDEAAQKYTQWRNYLTESQINKIYVAKISCGNTIADDFDMLVEADKIKKNFTQVEWQVVNKLATSPSLETFQNSLRLAWLNHIEEQNPILKAVSSLKMSQLEEALQQHIQQKQALSREILLLKLREQTYQDLEFNRLKNRVTFRELYHQTTKKRKVWSVRKLLENYNEDIFKLIPCWLVSPESASAIFPLTEGLFDLVIFDEASQCYAEYGIPALYRAKQFVVAGDSKQLAPTDLYRIRFEANLDEESPDAEIASLLDLVAQYVPQTTLKGHYRSQTLDLIAFSNQHFYQNKLQLLPRFEAVNRNEPAIQYVKIEGEWKNNSNQLEAKKVVELVQELTEKLPKKSIGIVTFNYQQQHLIEELLTNNPYIPSTLFVKNIENVQGDERDIIVFSVGYAPDAKGKVKAQFGSLNAQGGENRLNVAITRAKEKIYLVASCLPHQLDVENTANDGPKLFKSYLEYALDVSEGRFQPQSSTAEKHREAWLLKSLVSSHWSVGSDKSISETLPFADLSVQSKGNYESLILTDDDLYFDALSAKEAHAYLPLQLNFKGWAFVRIWSREWWRKQHLIFQKDE